MKPVVYSSCCKYNNLATCTATTANTNEACTGIAQDRFDHTSLNIITYVSRLGETGVGGKLPGTSES